MNELPMSGGEVVLTALSTVVALVMWIRWYVQPARLGGGVGGFA